VLPNIPYSNYISGTFSRLKGSMLNAGERVVHVKCSHRYNNDKHIHDKAYF